MTPRKRVAEGDPGKASLHTLSGAFALLSEVFLEPEADVKVRLGKVAAECPKGCPGLEGLPGALTAMAEKCEPPQAQAVEFVRLFLHGNGNATVHPYESVCTHGRLMAPQCLEGWNALYSAVGIRPRSDAHIPPDHLGLELEFLAYILTRLSAERDAEDLSSLRAAAKTALYSHLLPFSRLFVGKLSEANPRPYFASAAAALVEGLSACALILGPVEGAPPPGKK